MLKLMHKGDFSGIYALFAFVRLNLRISHRKFRIRLGSLVALYVAAIFCQVLAFFSFFHALKYYLSPDLMPSAIKTLMAGLELTSVEQLMCLLAPSFLLMLLSSKILNISRVGLSRLALDMKEGFEKYFYKAVKTEVLYQSSDFDKYVEASFGTVRALFLNSFVFIQSTVALIILMYLDFYIALICILSFVFFMISINRFTEKKANNAKTNLNDSSEECLDENLGLSSKSFERLERMRLFSRNYGAYLMLFVTLVGVIFSFEFMEELEVFTMVMLLVRYYGQIFTPVAVISAALFPYKKTITTLVNISKVIDSLDCYPMATSLPRNNISLIITRRYSRRNDLVHENKVLVGELNQYYKKEIQIATARFEDTHLLSNSDINKLMNKIKGKNNENFRSSDLLFCL